MVAAWPWLGEEPVRHPCLHRQRIDPGFVVWQVDPDVVRPPGLRATPGAGADFDVLTRRAELHRYYAPGRMLLRRCPVEAIDACRGGSLVA